MLVYTHPLPPPAPSQTCMHPCASHARAHTHKHTRAHAYTHTHACTHTHTSAHTHQLQHKRSLSLPSILQQMSKAGPGFTQLAVCVSGDVKHWKRHGEQPKPVNSWYYYSAPSAEVEMTSYALLATLEYYREDAVGRAQPIAFWLSNQQSAFGGFSSTQVVSL